MIYKRRLRYMRMRRNALKRSSNTICEVHGMKQKTKSILISLLSLFIVFAGVDYLGDFNLPILDLWESEGDISAESTDAEEESTEEAIHESEMITNSNVGSEGDSSIKECTDSVHDIGDLQLTDTNISTQLMSADRLDKESTVSEIQNQQAVKTNHELPEQVKSTLFDEEAIEYLQQKEVTQDGSTGYIREPDSLKVFGNQESSLFYVNTNASYNIWGYNVMSVSYNVSDIDSMIFQTCIEEGQSGDVQAINIYFDGAEVPSYATEVFSDKPPMQINLPIPKDAQLLKIEVINNSAHGLKEVFYDIQINMKNGDII